MGTIIAYPALVMHSICLWLAVSGSRVLQQLLGNRSHNPAQDSCGLLKKLLCQEAKLAGAHLQNVQSLLAVWQIQLAISDALHSQAWTSNAQVCS